ncbi:MAG: hypothetical protein IJD90_00090 [Clostridia bacterium]|nr:hypothetical protein [Clostridia bacterium]
MKKILKVFLSCVLVVVLMFSLTACTGFFTNPISLMQPPKLSGDLSEIENTLLSIHPNYQLSYPTSGKYRNAIIMIDLNEDSNTEAVVFYQVTENQTTTVHMNIMSYHSEDWVSKFDTTLTGAGIDRVEFKDVCFDSAKEILVGSKLYNVQENQLNVYCYMDSKITLLCEEKYTDYCVGNIGASKKPQIALFKISSVAQTVSSDVKDNLVKKSVSAKLLSFSYLEDGVPVTLGTAEFDSNIISFSSISIGKINDNQKGIYVDAFVGTSAMITEVLYYDETLKTLFYHKKANSTDATYREALIGCVDIDKDEYIEIPKTYLCQGYDTIEDINERVYFTEWYAVNGKVLGERKLSGFINTADSYFLQTSATWLGVVTVQRLHENRERVFYEWDATNRTYGEELFRIRVFLKSDFEKNDRNYKKAKSDDDYVYAVKINKNAQSQYAVDFKDIQENIILL